MKIIADDKIPFLKGLLEPFARVDYLPGNTINADSVRDADVLITRSITVCNSSLLKNSSIQSIATATIGTDHIDLDYCSRAGIQVYNAKGCNAAAVEQYVTTALLAISEKENIDLAQKTLGIVGVGAVGSRVQHAAGALGMHVLLNDPPREEQEGSADFVSLEAIQKQADFVSFHVPLVKNGKHPSFHLAVSQFFKGCAKPIHLLNTSRGSVVDGRALKNALLEKKVLAAVLDVHENEPLPDLELLPLLSIATPHIAGYSLQGKARGTAMVVQALSKQFGWKLDDWFPELNPVPPLEMNVQGLSDLTALQQIFKRVYLIRQDDKALRENPGNFEGLRRNYFYRNDNDALTLQLEHAGQSLLNRLKQMKFNIE